MGYRSSMPIIELKLTGPASEKQAMEKLWLDVKRVAGQSVIFEGTEGLPSQISRELQNRQFSLTLSEQFTGGLLALQLSRAGAPLLACEVVPSQEETLAQTAHWITERRANHFCRAGTGCFWFRERTSQLCASHARRHFRSACAFQHYALQPGYPSGSVRNDGTEYAAPLVKRPGHRQ